MKNVRFLPWVGKNYQAGFNGLRTLILGESHYHGGVNPEINNQPNFTIECIQEQVDGDFTFAFWTKVVTTMIGRKPTLDDKKQFWNSVAFYNYVQESAGSGPRIEPQAESWKKSEVPFAEVLETLKPNLIVALGYRMWDRLPNLDGRDGPKIESAPPQSGTWIYPHSDGCILLFNIEHPSSGGFSCLEWHKYILVAQEKAKDLSGAQHGCSVPCPGFN